MTATAATPPLETIENRKLRLITRIAEIEDEVMISLLEEVVSKEDEILLSNSEMAIIDKRLSAFKAMPDEFITLEQLSDKIKSLK